MDLRAMQNAAIEAAERNPDGLREIAPWGISPAGNPRGPYGEIMSWEEFAVRKSDLMKKPGAFNTER